MKTKLFAFSTLLLYLILSSCTIEEEFDQQEFNTNDPIDQDKILYDDLPLANSTGSSKYVLLGNKWDKTDLTYFYKNGSGYISNDDIKIGIREAFDLWAEVTPLVFKEVYNSDTADIVISFEDTSPNSLNEVLAYAHPPPAPNSGPLAGDIVFNKFVMWTLEPQLYAWGMFGPVDLKSVALHEIGHALGLDHDDKTYAVMNTYYTGTNFILRSDDIIGIRSIYGLESVPFSGNEDQYLTGDWDGDGIDNIAVRRGNLVVMDYNFDGSSDRNYRYGNGNSDEYLAGDWDGDGKDNIAVRRGNEIIMDFEFDGLLNKKFRYGNGYSDKYLVGDWNGDGTDNIAIRRGNQIIMDFDFDHSFNKRFRYGNGDSDKYLVGDWNGDGKDNIAVRRGNKIIMDFNFDGNADKEFRYGNGDSDKYLVGDWDGDGKDNIAVRRGNKIIMDFNFDGNADKEFRYGNGTKN